MWLLTLLPTEFLEFIVNAVLVIGIIATVLAFFVLNRLLLMFPPLAGYYRVIQVVSLVILCAGIYFKGGYSVEKMWRDRVAELEEKVKIAEKQAAKKNVEVQEKVVEKTRVVKEKGAEIVKYVDRWNTKEIIKEVEGPERVRVEEVIKYIESCPVPKEIIDIHNDAAKMNKGAARKEEAKK